MGGVFTSTNVRIETSTGNALMNQYSVAFLGFSDNEHKLIDAAIKLSEKFQNPLLNLVDTDQIESADVVFIDELYKAEQHHHLSNKVLDTQKDACIIRVNANPNTFAHVHISRPIQWFKLPTVVTSAVVQKSQLSSANMPAPLTNTVSSTASSSKSILIVDDSQITRDHIKMIVEQKGYQATAVNSVQEAVKTFKSQPFDCVIMDVMMPDVDGYDGCRQLKSLASPAHLPIIMLTGKSSPLSKFHGKIAGCDAYLTKPTTVSKIFSSIDKVFNQIPLES